jgi:hypothetical protein
MGLLHEEIIKKLTNFGKELGLIPIREFSLLNLEVDSDKKVDVAYLDNLGNLRYVVEVDNVPNFEKDKNPLFKLSKISDVIPNCRIYRIIFNESEINLDYVFDPSPNQKFLRFLKEEIKCL